MIYSMTAYAQRRQQTKAGMFSWEIRSINHRYLEIMTRLPEQFRSIDIDLRERIKKRISRGRLECVFSYTPAATIGALQLNQPLLQQLMQIAHKVTHDYPNVSAANVLDIVRWPNLVQEAELEVTAFHDHILDLLDQCISDLIANRAREGEALKELILQRVQQMQHHTAAVAKRLPIINAAIHDRLINKIAEFKADLDLDNNRIEQEIAIQLQKSDVAEELDRLNTHITEVQRVMSKGGVVGRRLDFLMQELNREANTLGAKAADAGLTNTVVELKVLIDQMREQIQNIE